jgi:signal transduction histidine kinase
LQAAETETLKRELERTRRRAERLQCCLVEAQRLATVGQLAGSMAHEFNNLLTMIIGRADQALKHDDPQMRRTALEKTVAIGERAGAIVRSLMNYATGRRTERRVVPADALMDAAVGLIEWHLPKENIQLVRQFETSAPVRVVPVEMEHVLLNLLLNARKAMKAKGGALSCAVTLADTPGYVALRVSDTGTGIASEHLDRIFEPFFTTASHADEETYENGGAGLGLPVARDLAQQAGGEIRVTSTPGAGSTFTVLLPIADANE